MSETRKPTDQALEQTETHESEDVDLRPVIKRTILLTLVLVVGVIIAGMYLKQPLSALANWIVDTYGIVGMLIGIFATDAFTFPIPPDTYLLIAVAGTANVWLMLAICCGGSVLAGNFAYSIGPYITRIPFISKRIETYRPYGNKLFVRYGVWTIVIAALTPIPFSIMCWLAGTYEMPRGKFFLATLARIPRLLGYYALFHLGWNL